MLKELKTMKKIFYLLGLATLFLVASCNNDITEQVPETKKYTPIVKGMFGEFTDTNPSTKAGVIEDNESFRDGEKFYWHDGDEVLLAFYLDGNLNEDPVTLTYTAHVEGGVKSKSADFTTDGGIDPGTYTVYGFYPAAAWGAEDDGVMASMAAPGSITNNGSSSYIGRNMFMKAKAENVVIEENGTNTVDLSYQHLGGVIRFHIRNTDENYPRLTELTLSKINNNGGSEPFFAASAYLGSAGVISGIDGDELIPVENSLLSSVSIGIAEGSNGLDFDFFLPFIPITPFEGGHSLRLQATFEGVSEPVTLFNIDSDDEILGDNGFEAGHSYFFNITNWEDPVFD